jgi:hypothetical protein
MVKFNKSIKNEFDTFFTLTVNPNAKITLKKITAKNEDPLLMLDIKKQKSLSAIPKNTLIFFHEPHNINYFNDPTFTPTKEYIENTLKLTVKMSSYQSDPNHSFYYAYQSGLKTFEEIATTAIV